MCARFHDFSTILIRTLNTPHCISKLKKTQKLSFKILFFIQTLINLVQNLLSLKISLVKQFHCLLKWKNLKCNIEINIFFLIIFRHDLLKGILNQILRTLPRPLQSLHFSISRLFDENFKVITFSKTEFYELFKNGVNLQIWQKNILSDFLMMSSSALVTILKLQNFWIIFIKL